MANEFFRAFGGDVAISLTPGGQGHMKVLLDGHKIFDRKEEGNIYPDLSRVRKMKEVIQKKLDSIPVHAH